MKNSSVACRKFSRKEFQNIRATPPPSPRTRWSATQYMAVVDAPMVTIGMEKTSHRTFRITRSATCEKNSQNGESYRKNFIKIPLLQPDAEINSAILYSSHEKNASTSRNENKVHKNGKAELYNMLNFFYGLFLIALNRKM